MTKKLTTISLIIFWIIIITLFVAGFIFYQNKKNNKLINSNENVTLNMAEIAKHNKQTDCWMLINGKVYNVTSYFGKHPGGNANMTATCGKDATAAYMTKDPNASTSDSRSAHSSNAISLLANYYIGDLDQVI
jgi:cytochrome b involved in lipid metabolism